MSKEMESLDEYKISLEKDLVDIKASLKVLEKSRQIWVSLSGIVIGTAYILFWIYILYPSKNFAGWIFLMGFYGTMFVLAGIVWLGEFLFEKFNSNHGQLPLLQAEKKKKEQALTLTNRAKHLLSRIDSDEDLIRRNPDRGDLSYYRNQIVNLKFKGYSNYEFESKIYDPATKILRRIENYSPKPEKNIKEKRAETEIDPIKKTAPSAIPSPINKPSIRTSSLTERSKPEPKAVVPKVYPIVTNLLKLFSTEKSEISKRNLELSRNVSTSTQGQKDYFKLSETNAELGLQGELFVIEQERSILIDLKRPDLANKIEHTSKDKGDQYGYDIISYDQFGNEKYIEVKTTTKSFNSLFYITDNELYTLSQNGNYFIYRVYNFDLEKKTGSIYVIDLMKNDLLNFFNLEPIVFAVRPNVLAS